MFKRILVPLDGSERAEHALPIAARLAQASNGTVILQRVVTPPVEYTGYLNQGAFVLNELVEASIAEATTYLIAVSKSKPLEHIKTRIKVMVGSPAREILFVARSRRIDLVVMCSHGRTGITRWILGSVAHKVVHHSPVPVLVLRSNTPDPTYTELADNPTVLLPLDGSLLSEAALRPAARLVTSLAETGTLHLVHVIKLSAFADTNTKPDAEAIEQAKAYLVTAKERLQDTLQDVKLSITWSVAINTDIASALIGIAENNAEGGDDKLDHLNYHLIAMSTHGRGDLRRWTMGSITERVLDATSLPMLIIRPQKAETRQEEREEEATQADVPV